MKERVTLTIEANLLRQIDNSIDGNEIRNRSHAVELLLREAMRENMPEHAIILAGGDDQANQRALKEVDGKPLIQHNLELFTNAGINHIIIITKEPEKLKETISQPTGTNIQYITETHKLGTAGALHLAKPYLQSTFLVTNADDTKTLNLQEMHAFHKQTTGLCTIALTTTDTPSKYGVALLNGNRIVTFVEKPKADQAPSNLISAGLYLMEPAVIDLIPDGYARMEYDIFPKLTQEDKLYGYPFSGAYQDY